MIDGSLEASAVLNALPESADVTESESETAPVVVTVDCAERAVIRLDVTPTPWLDILLDTRVSTSTPALRLDAS